MSSPPVTAVSTPARNGRDHTDDGREKTPNMSGEPGPLNGATNGDSGAQHADDNPPAPSSEHSAAEAHGPQRGEKQIKVLVDPLSRPRLAAWGCLRTG